MRKTYILMACLLAAVIIPEPAAGQNPSDNRTIILDEIIRILGESSLISEHSDTFLFESDIPRQHHARLVESLLNMNKRVMLESYRQEPKINLELYTENKLTRLNRQNAERHITGEVVLYLADGEQVISQTNRYAFNHTDTIGVAGKDRLNSENWQAARFHEEIDGRRRSLISRVAEPVIIIGAAAITVFLLYNVRQ